MNTRKQLTEAEIVGDYAAIRGQITQILLPMERCEKGKHLIQPLAGTTLGIVYAVDSPMERKLIPITWTMVETWGVPLYGTYTDCRGQPAGHPAAACDANRRDPSGSRNGDSQLPAAGCHQRVSVLRSRLYHLSGNPGAGAGLV